MLTARPDVNINSNPFTGIQINSFANGFELWSGSSVDYWACSCELFILITTAGISPIPSILSATGPI